MDQRDTRCLKLTLALADIGAYDESLRIIVDLLELIGVVQLNVSYLIGRLDLSKVASCVSSNFRIIMTGTVGFYALTATYYLLSFLLTKNFEMWANFLGLKGG